MRSLRKKLLSRVLLASLISGKMLSWLYNLFAFIYYFHFRHSTEMDMLQRKMEELQRHYMQEKETLRVDLVQTLFNTRKLQQQEVPCSYPAQSLGHGEGLDSEGLSPAMLQLQQEQQRIQHQIQAQLRQEQRGQQQIAGQAAVFSPPPTSQLMQPAPRFTLFLVAGHLKPICVAGTPCRTNFHHSLTW